MTQWQIFNNELNKLINKINGCVNNNFIDLDIFTQLQNYWFIIKYKSIDDNIVQHQIII